VTVLESWDRLDERLRATQYGVPATRVFRKAGLIDDIREASIESFPSICWRKTSTHEKLANVDLSVIKDHPDRMTILPLNALVHIMYKHCMEKTEGRVEVKFKHEVVALGQSESKAWVDVKIDDAEHTTHFEADYVVGCDGGKSVIRHCLFGRNWPGVTFDCHLTVQNVWYDGFEKEAWDGGNYMVDPDYWGLIAKRGKGGLWRVTYGDIGGLTDEEYEQRREKAFEKMLPGHPKASDYKITLTDHFTSHNRCVASMRVGRVLLAGDAAHVSSPAQNSDTILNVRQVNNPWGGYGCMAAVLDAGGLADCLIGMYQGRADEDILDLYSQVRREKFLKYIDVRSQRNFNRVRNREPDKVMENDKLLKIFQEIEGDAEATKAFLLVSMDVVASHRGHSGRGA
jgi:2-polyprenyl-6-methoxyphenol hydroxylase-like FAD-dependent oxidoreductase